MVNPVTFSVYQVAEDEIDFKKVLNRVDWVCEEKQAVRTIYQESSEEEEAVFAVMVISIKDSNDQEVMQRNTETSCIMAVVNSTAEIVPHHC